MSRSKKSRSAERSSKENRSRSSPSSRSRASAPSKSRSRAVTLSLIVAAVLVIVFAAHRMSLPTQPRIEPYLYDAESAVEFTDVARQAREFMTYNRTIELTRAQEAVKREALSRMHAACCSDYSAYTCCCECNLSRTVWGLSNHLIADKGYDADQTSATVAAWLEFVNPAGFGGDACFTGRCGSSFAHDGCGGMSESALAL